MPYCMLYAPTSATFCVVPLAGVGHLKRGIRLQRAARYCAFHAQVAQNAYVLVRAVPQDLEAWLEYCAAHAPLARSQAQLASSQTQPASSQAKISPSVFAWMCIGFGAKWPPVVRHSLRLAHADAMLGRDVTAAELYDHMAKLLTFAGNHVWEPPHANLSYTRQAFSTGLVTLAKRMGMLSGSSASPPPKRRRTKGRDPPTFSQASHQVQASSPAFLQAVSTLCLGQGQNSYVLLPRQAGEARFQALLDAGAKARHQSHWG